MKCDDFLPALVTGAFHRRLLARLHARRCGHCAQARRGLARLENLLAQPAELTGDLRRKWRLAAETPAQAARPWPGRPRLVLALAGAALVAAAGVYLLNSQMAGRGGRQPARQIADSQRPGPPTQRADPAVRPAAGAKAQLYSAAELAELDAGLARLSGDLDQLAAMAELLDARVEVDKLLITYRPLGADPSGEPPPL